MGFYSSCCCPSHIAAIASIFVEFTHCTKKRRRSSVSGVVALVDFPTILSQIIDAKENYPVFCIPVASAGSLSQWEATEVLSVLQGCHLRGARRVHPSTV